MNEPSYLVFSSIGAWRKVDEAKFFEFDAFCRKQPADTGPGCGIQGLYHKEQEDGAVVLTLYIATGVSRDGRMLPWNQWQPVAQKISMILRKVEAGGVVRGVPPWDHTQKEFLKDLGIPYEIVGEPKRIAA